MPLRELVWSLLYYPRASAEVKWKHGALSLNLGYRYSLIRDTLAPLRSPLYEHQGELTASTYHALPDLEAFGPLTTRSYVSLRLPVDGRWAVQALEELSFAVRLNPRPLIRFLSLSTVNLEHGADDTGAEYYLPSGILEARQVLIMNALFHPADYSRVFEVALSGGLGAYAKNVFKEGARKVNLRWEAGLTATYTAGNFTGYGMFNVSGLAGGSQGQNANDYWQITGTLGVRARTPALLAR